MRIRVLGSSAGGGFPQWNCGCPNCLGIRSGTIAAQSRTQESVAISADGDAWYLINASPEIRAQIESFSPLHPRSRRHSPIAGILLTNGDLDHCLGLLSLRESHPLTVYATGRVREGFTRNNAIYSTLERFQGQVSWRKLELGQKITLARPDGRAGALEVEPLAVPGQPPLHLRGTFAPMAEDNIGLRIVDHASGGVLAYFSGVAMGSAALRAALSSADCIFFDGTFWSSDELIALGLGERRAEDMAHWPIGGAEGSLATLRDIGRRQRYFIHINNTNPILREDSAERAEVRAAGWDVAHDGLEVAL